MTLLKTTPQRPWLPWAIAGGLLLAVAIVYGQAGWFDFLEYDDNLFVRDCPQVRAGLTPASIRWAMTDGPMGEWYPLAMLSHMLDCQLFGLHASGHHLTNILLHAASSVLLFWVLWRMTAQRAVPDVAQAVPASGARSGTSERREGRVSGPERESTVRVAPAGPSATTLWPSALVAFVFAVHPQHVESVVWIAERRDVLSGLFFMLTLAAYVGYVRHGCGVGRYLLVMILLALGLMSKSMLVTVPPLLLLLDYWPLGRFGAAAVPLVNQGTARRSFAWLVVEKLPLVALAAVDTALTMATHAKNRPIPLPERLSTAVVAVAGYLEQFICPVDLAIFYPYSFVPAWQVAGSVTLILVISAAVFWWRKRVPYLLIGWCWFLGMLLPVLGLVQIADHATADRYMYLPSIGLCVAIAWGGAALAQRSQPARRLLAVSAVAACAALTVVAAHQTSLWRDGVTLWNHTISVTGENDEALTGLAESLRVAGRMDEAIKIFRRAEPTATEPNFFNNYGTTLMAAGDLDTASYELHRGLAINPRSAVLWDNLGAAQARQRKFSDAEQSFRRAIDCDATIPGPHVNLARALFSLERLDEAIRECQTALDIAPGDPDAEKGLAFLLEARAKASRP